MFWQLFIVITCYNYILVHNCTSVFFQEFPWFYLPIFTYCLLRSGGGPWTQLWERGEDQGQRAREVDPKRPAGGTEVFSPWQWWQNHVDKVCLIGGLEYELHFPYIGNVIIPTDELIFFRGVGQPPTRWSMVVHDIWGSSHIAMGLARQKAVQQSQQSQRPQSQQSQRPQSQQSQRPCSSVARLDLSTRRLGAFQVNKLERPRNGDS